MDNFSIPHNRHRSAFVSFDFKFFFAFFYTFFCLFSGSNRKKSVEMGFGNRLLKPVFRNGVRQHVQFGCWNRFLEMRFGNRVSRLLKPVFLEMGFGNLGKLVAETIFLRFRDLFVINSRFFRVFRSNSLCCGIPVGRGCFSPPPLTFQGVKNVNQNVSTETVWSDINLCRRNSFTQTQNWDVITINSLRTKQKGFQQGCRTRFNIGNGTEREREREREGRWSN